MAKHFIKLLLIPLWLLQRTDQLRHSLLSPRQFPVSYISPVTIKVFFCSSSSSDSDYSFDSLAISF